MPKTDLSLYYATLDSPGGPMYVDEVETDDGAEHIARDEHGNATLGGRIGQLLASMLLLGMFLYFWFAI
jgi:hypothetical protein